MILRMNQHMFRPKIAVRPAVAVNEIQNLKYASPDPDRMSRIETGCESLIQGIQATPKTAWMPQHQSLLAIVSFHDSLRNRLRHES